MDFIEFLASLFWLLPRLGVIVFVVICADNIRLQNESERAVSKGPALFLLFGTVAYGFVFWMVSSDELKILSLIIRCGLPALAAGIAAMVTHGRQGGEKLEYMSIIVAFAATALITGIFKSILLEILVGVIVMAVLCIVISMIVEQQEMNYHATEKYGDSELVRKLYKKGYKPKGYYGDARSRYNADKKMLLYHDVNLGGDDDDD